MDILAAEVCIGIRAPLVDRFFGGFGWDQAVATLADQIVSTDMSQGISDLKVVFRFEKLHQSPL